MKTIKYLSILFIAAFTLASCSKDDDDDTIVETDPMEAYNLLKEFIYTDHTVELYSEKTLITTGYNSFFVRIKDKSTNTFVENVNLSWMPMMHMETMMHSAPKSVLTATETPSIYNGFIVFQMPGNTTEYWDITFNYTFKGAQISKTERIEVQSPADALSKVSAFMGSDNVRYILAYVSPKNPEVAINDFTAVLYKMEDMMTFTNVENYKVTIDPRMPGMGNHSSPNNEDLTYNAQNGMYEGKLSLTMTGYWKINLKLLNAANEVLKGEDVTEENLESSLYFELEF